MGQVLVLNAGYEPLNVCTVRRAHVLVFKGKAEVIEQLEKPLRAAVATFPWPLIRLLHYVRVPRAIQRKISRRALFARDGWRCVYCGDLGRAADARPRGAAVTGRRVRLGERRHGVRAVQPAQGRPLARGERPGAVVDAEAPRARALHPPGGPADSAWLAALPRHVLLGRIASSWASSAASADSTTTKCCSTSAWAFPRRSTRCRRRTGTHVRRWARTAASTARPRARSIATSGRSCRFRFRSRPLFRVRDVGRGRRPELRPPPRALARRAWAPRAALRREAGERLPPYAGTLGLPVMLQLREVNLLPTVELVETDHVLRAEQRDGITEARAQELAAPSMTLATGRRRRLCGGAEPVDGS